MSAKDEAWLREFVATLVPEIASGAVLLKGLAREPGVCTILVPSATAPNVDPVAACVGPHGARIKALVRELHNEKVEVVHWSDDPAELILNLLAPLHPLHVELEKDPSLAIVYHRENQDVSGLLRQLKRKAPLIGEIVGRELRFREI